MDRYAADTFPSALQPAEACAHPALARDLEYRALFPGGADTRHLRREQQRIEEILQEGGTAYGTRNVLGLLRPLAWDQAHFGFPCADLSRFYIAEGARQEEIGALVQQLIEACRKGGFRFVSARLPADALFPLHLLLSAGFRLIDTSVEIGALHDALAAHCRQPPDGGLAIATATRDQLPALQEIAATFTDNRFHRDPRIPLDLASALYQSWVISAAEDGRVLVVLEEKRPIAFCTLSPPDKLLGVATMGLVAVAPRHRGRGLVGRLVARSANMAGGTALATSTQLTNAPALRAFAKAGLRPYGARHILHGWTDDFSPPTNSRR